MAGGMMAELVGVYQSERGPLRALGRFLGLPGCDLSRITDSRTGVSASWKALLARLASDGHTHDVVTPRSASPEIRRASAGREPCVLILHDSGDIAMIADWNDLALAHGDIPTYERILRSKLLMY